MRTWIKGGILINEGRMFRADVLIENDRIRAIGERFSPEETAGCRVVSAAGRYVIPGVIDDQVHFREPGLTHKGDMAEGSRAAAAGGITSFMDMPNVNPPTTSRRLLEQKQEIAARNSLVNYSFYLGATSGNLDEIKQADPATVCGIKVFMGSSTGNMLVDQLPVLERIFAESPLLIATHSEDNPTIEANLSRFKERYGEDIPAACHPEIRSREACFKSSSLAVSLARKFGSRLHLLHLSTAEETGLLDGPFRPEKKITGEAVVHHLWFNDEAYRTKGHLVKWNPAIKQEADRVALLKAVNAGIIDVIGTDHAPHTFEEKSGVYTQAASGGPMVQHSLCVMLELAERGETTPEIVVERMCHTPAALFRIEERGFLRPGYKADICIVEKNPWTVEKENLLYRCGWSPLEGCRLTYRVHATFVNGRQVYENGAFDEGYRGEMLRFRP
ncbi:MAG: dihydroorotase [Culturomica sp.]|nr:dihydroorotase [Culturomica sp.]